MSKFLIACVVILVLFGGCAVSTYNGLISQDETVQSSWSEVQNQYKRRFELIPQLVATVKGAANFEKSTMLEVTEARNAVSKLSTDDGALKDPAQTEAYMKAQSALGSSLNRMLNVTVERYPDLKASKNFLGLQDQLEGTDNRIATARRDYIDSIKKYNTKVRKFPANILAGMFGFETLDQMKFDEAEQKVEKIDFSK
ncbi:MAG: LemA family protein [Planctomycetota bacterium]|nr:LemA family protein [Planctomycetota bacterium]